MHCLTLILAPPIVWNPLFEQMFSVSQAAREEDHEHWMRAALGAALEAQTRDQVPIGSCIVVGEKLLAIARNCTRTDCAPTAPPDTAPSREPPHTCAHFPPSATTTSPP